MEILDIYKSLLSNAGMTANEQGFISMSLAGMEEQPVLIKGKRLVMPTEKQLGNGDFSKRVVFHPLSESISRGESEVVTSFREHLNARINFITGYVSICLLTLATDVQKHKELNPEQLEMLLKIKDADEGTLERFQKITERMMVGDDSMSFSRISIRKNHKVGDRSHRRVAVVTFPFYEELIKPVKPKTSNEIYGIKLRNTDRATMIGLMEYIFPNIGDINYYIRFSDSEVAPTIDALMRGVLAVGDPLNTVVETFDKYIEDSEKLKFDGEWEKPFSNLFAYQTKINMIPMQPGNEGTLPVKAVSGVPTVNVTDSAAQPTNIVTDTSMQTTAAPVSVRRIDPPAGGIGGGSYTPAQPAPVQSVAPVQISQPVPDMYTSARVPATAHVVQPQQQVPALYQTAPVVQQPQFVQPQVYQPVQPVQQPMLPPPPVGYTYVNGQMVPYSSVPNVPVGYMVVNNQIVPLNQQVQPQAPVGIQHTASGRVDFNSFIAGNPAIAQNAAIQSQLMYQRQMGAQYPRNDVPRWARGNTNVGI